MLVSIRFILSFLMVVVKVLPTKCGKVLDAWGLKLDLRTRNMWTHDYQVLFLIGETCLDHTPDVEGLSSL
jgi:hypothetical protein